MVSEMVIRSIALFKQLPPIMVQRLACAAHIHYYKKGAVVLDNLSIEKKFFYIMAGWVKLFTTTQDGADVVMDLLTVGQYIGETLLFEEIDEEDHYSIKALTDLQVFSLPIAALKEFVKQEPQLTLGLLQQSIYHQRQLALDIEHLSTQNTVQRLGCFLLKLCKTNSQKNITLQLPCDKSVLAARLGMRPETFSRALTKLCHTRLITVHNDIVSIKDINELSAYVYQRCIHHTSCDDIKFSSILIDHLGVNDTKK